MPHAGNKTYKTLILQRGRTLLWVVSRMLFATVGLIFGIPASSQTNVEQVMEIGKNALYFEDYVVAIQYFNQAINTKPYLAKPYFYRAVAKMNLEDFHGASEDAGKALELNEFITDAWQIRAISRQMMGDHAGCIGDYKKALELTPRVKGFMFNLAIAYSHEKEYEQADSMFTEILEYYPGYEDAFRGRAEMRLERGDTIGALADLDSALVLDPNSLDANLRRAHILLDRKNPLYRNALVNLDKAVKLDPNNIDLLINRSVVRYNTNDWWGAKEDMDKVISLDPNNEVARFNRAVLNLEASANDQAHDDLSFILRREPGNYRARYTRAVVRFKKQNYKGAIEDITQVLKVLPDYAAGYLWRAEMQQNLGNYEAAQADFERSEAITKRLRSSGKKVYIDLPDMKDKSKSTRKSDVKPKEKQLSVEELTERDFLQLLTVPDDNDLRPEYNNTAMRGRVQDVNTKVEPEPMVELSFYTSPSEINENRYYIKEVDELNRTGQLHYVVYATVNPPLLNDEESIAGHFNAIEYFNSYLATHTPRAVDYLGRALNFITVRDYDSAIRDIDRSLALNPNFAPSYMLRAQSRMKLWKSMEKTEPHIAKATIAVKSPKSKNSRKGNKETQATTMDAMTRASIEQKQKDDIMADLDKAIELAPNNPYVYYNKAVALIEFGNVDGTIDLLSRALELNPDFAPAYYNRGYVFLERGQRDKGIADLSQAGSLGVIPAYNLMKRIMKQQ